MVALFLSLVQAALGSIVTIVVGLGLRPLWRAGKATRQDQPVPSPYDNNRFTRKLFRSIQWIYWGGISPNTTALSRLEFALGQSSTAASHLLHIVRGAAIVFNPYPASSSLWGRRKQIVFVLVASGGLIMLIALPLVFYLTASVVGWPPPDDEARTGLVLVPTMLVTGAVIGGAFVAFYVASDPGNSGRAVAIIHNGFVHFPAGLETSYGLIGERWRWFRPEWLEYRSHQPKFTFSHLRHPIRAIPLVEIKAGNEWLVVSKVTGLTLFIITLLGEHRDVPPATEAFLERCKEEAIRSTAEESDHAGEVVSV